MGDEEKPQVDHLNLKVVTQDGNEIFFKCAAVPPPPAPHPFDAQGGRRILIIPFEPWQATLGDPGFQD